VPGLLNSSSRTWSRGLTPPRSWPSQFAALALSLLLLLGVALPANSEQPGVSPAGPTVEIFVREGCSHCREAEHFLRGLQAEFPGLRVTERDVSKDPAALADLRELAETLPQAQLGLPTFRVGERVIVGFSGAEGTGIELRALVDPSARALVARRTEIPLLGKIDVGDYGLPLFTVMLGLLDGFNPCALWVLLFILSLLVHLESRRRMAVVAGTFLLVSGVVYFAFMAAWLNFFLLLGAARGVQVALAGIALAAGAVHVKDYFAWHRGLTLSIPDKAKPRIGARTRAILQAESLPATLLAVGVLALMVNSVELLCTAGLPAIYTQVLSTHELPPWKHYAYLLLYNGSYMLDDTILVFAAVITMNPRRLGETGGRRLKLVSGLVMIALAVLLLARPEWLSWEF